NRTGGRSTCGATLRIVPDPRGGRLLDQPCFATAAQLSRPPSVAHPGRCRLAPGPRRLPTRSAIAGRQLSSRLAPTQRGNESEILLLHRPQIRSDLGPTAGTRYAVCRYAVCRYALLTRGTSYRNMLDLQPTAR